jgi:hypothetical protein
MRASTCCTPLTCIFPFGVGTPENNTVEHCIAVAATCVQNDLVIFNNGAGSTVQIVADSMKSDSPQRRQLSKAVQVH